MTDLLPCPFCGGEAIAIHEHKWWVACRECKAENGFIGMDMSGNYGYFDTEEQAIAAWNTRVDVERGAIPMTEENMAKHGWVRERTCNFSDHVADVAWCSECKKPMEYPNHPNYCPNCGARVVE